MIRTHGLTHIALAVRDKERSFRFYETVFGVRQVYRDRGQIQVQTPGCRDVIVFDETASRPGETSGVSHFGFRLVDRGDIDAATKAVERAGGRVLEQGEFVPGSPTCMRPIRTDTRSKFGTSDRADRAGRSSRGPGRRGLRS